MNNWASFNSYSNKGDKDYRRYQSDTGSLDAMPYWARSRLAGSKNTTSRNKKLKYEIKMLFGGCCSICGYDKNLAALDFHHKSKKNFSISVAVNGVIDDIFWKELAKCKLICSNCHRDLHYPSWRQDGK